MNLAAIVQARTGSTRFPGKVLKRSGGRPLLCHLLDRLRAVPPIDTVVVATTVLAADDALAELAAAQGFLVARGSVDDVLDRCVLAARQVDARNIMRITADCPLLDPEICARVWELHAQSNADYTATGQDFAEGLDCEIITREALERSHRDAILASEREHVTLYVRNHPELFRLVRLENDRDDSRYRVTVDEPADFEVVDAVLNHLSTEPGAGFGFAPVRGFLDAHPEVAEKNARIIRNEGLLKSLAQDRPAGGRP
ncbi:MAG: Acylneuraminate [Desulfovibrionaceae bacterium]|nr:MAG: Acylneuraminate [Desulfovibrionaceae bacterium]